MSNKNRVCHLTSVHRAFDVRIFHKQCCSLAQSGFIVSLVAVGEDKDCVVSNVNVHYVRPSKTRFGRIFYTSIKVAIKALSTKANVFHLHDPELLPVGILFSIFGKKVIFDYHEDVEAKLLERDWLAKPFRKVAVSVFNLLSYLGEKLFVAKIAATPKIKTLHRGKLVEVIANYPIARIISSSPKEFCGSKVELIYTGGWSKNRGAKQLVQAMEYVKSEVASLTVIGQVQVEELNLVKKLDGYKKVRDLGQVSFEESVNIMKSSQIGLVCSQNGHGYEEALPNKLFEYMAVGLPVIASDFSYWRDILTGYECVVFVDPSDPKAIADAIDYLIDNPITRTKLASEGIRAIQEKFSWEHEAKKLVSIYEEVCR